MNQTQTASGGNFETFMALLRAAGAISLDDGPYLHDWTTAETTGDAENQVLRLSWESEGNTFSTIFTELGLDRGIFKPNGTFVCEDYEGQTFTIKLFTVSQLSPAGAFPTSSVAQVLMQDIVGDYEAPGSVPEWQWVERNRSFAHKDNGQDGIWEFVLNLSMTFDDIPESLLHVIERARAEGVSYLHFHQDT